MPSARIVDLGENEVSRFLSHECYFKDFPEAMQKRRLGSCDIAKLIKYHMICAMGK